MESYSSHLQFGGPNENPSGGSGEPNGERSVRTNAVKASSILKFTICCCCGFKIWLNFAATILHQISLQDSNNWCLHQI